MRNNIPSMAAVSNPKPIVITWNKWARGLNKLVNASKIEDDELSEATNVILEDEGNPIRRPGSDYYGDNSGGTTTLGLTPYYNSNGTKQLLKVEDGILKKLNSNDTWSIITGASFASGQRINTVLLNDTLYFGNGVDNLTKYNGSILERFAPLSAPTSNWSTRGASLISGQNLYSYRVTALTAVGETLPCAATTIAVDKKRDTWNTDPTALNANYSVTINWLPVTGAVGYNIYGIYGSEESYIENVRNATSWIDYGDKEPSNVFTLPLADTTSGPIGKYIIEYKSALMIAGDPSAPSRLYYSAGVDKPESFLIGDGGGWIDVSKDSDDGVISGLSNFQNKLIIFKERSIWGMDFGTGAVPSLSNIVKGFGCISHNSILPVENDLLFLGRKVGKGPALYVLGNEANYLTILRTNELSARLRPIMASLIGENFERANATYLNGRYCLFFTSGNVTYNNAAIVYDHERKGFTYWEGINANFSTVFYDENGDEWLLFLDGADNRVSYINENLTSDKGSTIQWRYRTKDIDLENVFRLKKNKMINLRLKNPGGLVKFKVWVNGNNNGFEYNQVLQTTELTTSFRGLKFRSGRFRKTVSGNAGAPEDTIIVRLPIKYLGDVMTARSIGLEVIGEALQSCAGLLEVEFIGMPRSKGYYPKTEIIYN